jgi:hypothetical protein
MPGLVVGAILLALGVKDTAPVVLLELCLRIDVYLHLDRVALLADREDRHICLLYELPNNETWPFGAPLGDI